MVFGLSVSDSKKSKIRRLSFLPRVDFTIDVFDKKIRYTQVPLSELMYNLYKDGINKENAIRIIKAQITEVRKETK
ncbi:MAG: hypothetical protein MK008_11935 [Bdellovibrionales bacterium]|nr:hypothetical protein [Bdellovibrionales bacterium]